jgi:hypothetical protein
MSDTITALIRAGRGKGRTPNMNRIVKITALGFALPAAAFVLATSSVGGAAEWSMNGSIIEACSCPMFCQCYFNDRPAAHGHEHHAHGKSATHFCRFNNVYKINNGHYGAVKLDGVKWWLSGDLGEDFATWKGSWGVLTVDKAATKEQREAIGEIAKHLLAVKWGSFKTATGEISWHPGSKEAHALLDGGKTAEVKLKAPGGANEPAEPIVIRNLKYWGAQRNDGFIMMPNVVQAYRAGDKPYETKGTAGFMIKTFEIDSESVAKAAQGASRK